MPDGDEIRRALDLAIAEATSAGSEAVEPLHLLIGVLRLGDRAVELAISACGIDPVRLRRHLRGYARRTVRPSIGGPLRIARRTERVLANAKHGSTQSAGAVVACALLDPIDAGIGYALSIEGIDVATLVRALNPGRESERSRSASGSRRPSTRRTKREVVAELEAALGRRVVGQDHALATVASVVAPAMAGERRAGRPRASLLFVGPGDVGRSSVARALAENLHGDPRRLVRVRAADADWSTQLSAAVTATPRTVVYVDALESLGPDDRAPFAAMLTEGVVRRGRAAPVSLEDAVVVIGTTVGCDAGGSMSPGDVRRKLVAELGDVLVGAVDRIVLFQQLAVDDIREIASQWLDDVAVQARLRDGVDVRIQPGAVDGLAEIGVRIGEGPCAMRRVVDRSIVAPLRDAIASGALRRGDAVLVVDGPQGPILADEVRNDFDSRGDSA